jgi:hypothetical protein
MQASFNNILSLLNHNCSSTPKSKITIRHGNMSYYLQCFVEKDFYFFIFDVLTQHFSYIMATSFSGGRSRSIQREPPTMGKQLVNFITCCCESSAPFL